MGKQYWLRVLSITAVSVLIVSKSFFIFLFITWGQLPDRIYNTYMYIGNWPSLLSGTFPYLVDRTGAKGIDIVSGIIDIKSAVVNIIGWLPIGLFFGYLCRKKNTTG